MIEVTVKPVVEDCKIVATVKKVRVFGILIYRKVIFNSPRGMEETYYNGI
jgi:hypothetical protein